MSSRRNELGQWLMAFEAQTVSDAQSTVQALLRRLAYVADELDDLSGELADGPNQDLYDGLRGALMRVDDVRERLHDVQHRLD